MSENATTTTDRPPGDSRRTVWMILLVFFAATAVLAPIRVLYRKDKVDEARDAAANGDTNAVTIVPNSFEPDVLTVTAGTTVVWTNTGGRHTVTADEGEFSSEPLDDGQTFEAVINGSVTYHCDFHADMTATIEVEE